MTLLIADDSVLFRERIRNLVLKHKNIQILGEPTNGVETMHLINIKLPDMIILDIGMPFMNGIQVLEKLKLLNTKTIVCILTGYHYPQYRQKCLTLGADYFFNKYDDFEKINSALEIELIKHTIVS